MSGTESNALTCDGCVLAQVCTVRQEAQDDAAGSRACYAFYKMTYRRLMRAVVGGEPKVPPKRGTHLEAVIASLALTAYRRGVLPDEYGPVIDRARLASGAYQIVSNQIQMNSTRSGNANAAVRRYFEDESRKQALVYDAEESQGS